MGRLCRDHNNKLLKEWLQHDVKSLSVFLLWEQIYSEHKTLFKHGVSILLWLLFKDASEKKEGPLNEQLVIF